VTGQTIDDIETQSGTLIFIETTSEFTTQNHEVWSNVCKLLLIALEEMMSEKFPNCHVIGGFTAYFHHFR
jgi:hypothetical protein